MIIGKKSKFVMLAFTKALHTIFKDKKKKVKKDKKTILYNQIGTDMDKAYEPKIKTLALITCNLSPILTILSLRNKYHCFTILIIYLLFLLTRRLRLLVIQRLTICL
jgi:hypothetical protein